ncbi:SDR family oxidoreductase [Frankia sp. AgB1.9]|uniref:SDR family NAD(P)-dependent oxidoreductase n=1 Tax=unclassified Frankia TaxID=2632575 RepID=UPI0019334D78|nr:MULTISPECIES: SDR family oxidoreductase [unclassified Frankia]MBL7488476.1 SDR family oxidoreductase [Frankia sp. AgW1.1]MBL7551129.1 SDR family oxidoreductase [Frankia sp. AgB1.9]MBL7620837.1 SDR family oxidoreductase [Frankia sp. AgB1.8]
MDRFSQTGRVAVITGGGTGIGRASALALAEYGADVVLTARRPEPLESTAKEVEALGRRALALPADVTKASECQRIVDATLAEFGRLDVLVNCAGGGTTKSIRSWSEDEWHQMLALNLGSVWFLTRAASVPMLAQGKGAVVNISSGASLLGMPQAAPYGAAKAGVNSLTASMAAAWTRKGIRVNNVVVGAINSASLTDDLARAGIDPALIAQTNASGRIGEPDEIANAVLFFASDAASFCSGQSLYVHGGPGPAGI